MKNYPLSSSISSRLHALRWAAAFVVLIGHLEKFVRFDGFFFWRRPGLSSGRLFICGLVREAAVCLACGSGKVDCGFYRQDMK
ncbi:MAG: hypothetical protein PHW66_01620 [Gallionella sp.]|nr:hypothetical protein [Gallionella sp.]